MRLTVARGGGTPPNGESAAKDGGEATSDIHGGGRPLAPDDSKRPGGVRHTFLTDVPAVLRDGTMR